MATTALDAPVRYRVTGMDCSSCAAKIEGAARTVAGVQDVRASIASQEMTLRVDKKGATLPEVERAVTGLGYKLARLKADDDDDKIPDLSHVTTPTSAHYGLWYCSMSDMARSRSSAGSSQARRH